MAHHKIEIDCECKKCQGTGLYSGFGERNGAAIVCYGCKGTGETHMIIEYDDFVKRNPSYGIKRVLKCNPGVGVGENKKENLCLEDFGGITYEDWNAGKEFGPGTEMRKFTCPSWWYQSANFDKRPNWKECGFGEFTACKEFCNKDKCWERFDKENE